MANVIKHKRGSGSDPGASDLVVGEVAIRTDTGKLFTKMDNGSVAEIAGGGSDIAINTLSSSSGTGGGSATFNGSAYRFTLSAPPSVSAYQLLVSINGVIQKPVAGTGQPSEGFSVDGNDIILGDAPATGSDFFILTFKSLGVSEPADNSVTSAKIADGAIVNADINASAAIARTKLANVDVVDDTSPQLGGNLASNGNHIVFADDDRAKFGTGNDLNLYHTSNENYIEVPNAGTGNLNIVTNGGKSINIKAGNNVTGSNNSVICNNAGSVDLYHNGSKKLETTSTGATATGHLTVQDTSGDSASSRVYLTSGNTADSSIYFGRANDTATAGIRNDHSDDSLRFYGYNNAERMRIDSSGNIGIGTTSPSNKLVVNSPAHDDGLYVLAANNNQSTRIRIQGKSSSGTEHNWNLDVARSADRFGITNGVSTHLAILDGGNVGIGTTSPSDVLDVVHAANTASGISIRNTNNSQGSAFAQLLVSGGDNAKGRVKIETNGAFHTIDEDSNGNLILEDNGTERMRIDSSGKVGIGTTSPATLLNINVDTEANLGSGSEGIRLTSGTSNAQFVRLGDSYSNNSVTGPGTLLFSSNKLSLRCDNGNPITFHTGSTVAERMRIDSSGKVGIGTSSPERQLHIVGNDGATGATLGNSDTCLVLDNQQGNGAIMEFLSDNDGAGRIMFTDTDASNQGKIQYFHDNDYFNIEAATSVQGMMALHLTKQNAANNVQSDMINFDVGGSGRGKIVSAPNGSSSPQFSSYSDRRLKTNIKDYTGGYEKIKSLKIRIYDEISNDDTKSIIGDIPAKSVIGYIADEFQEVFPQEVRGTKDEIDSDGKPVYQSISDTFLTPYLVQALQEAVGKIETLETKVAALEAK